MSDETDTDEVAPKRTRRRRPKPATESTTTYAGTLAKQVAALVNVESSAELREKVAPLAVAIDGLESGAPATTGGEALLARIAELGDQLSDAADQAAEHATARAALEQKVAEMEAGLVEPNAATQAWVDEKIADSSTRARCAERLAMDANKACLIAEAQVVDLLAVELEVIGALRRGAVLREDETPSTVELVALMKRLRGTT